MRFDRGSIMAPIGSPTKMTGRDQMSIGGLGGNSDSRVSGGFMPQPAFDPSALERQIGGLQEQIGNIPSYDDTNIRNMIGNIPQFDDSAIRRMIEDNQRSIGNIPSFDSSGLQSQIEANKNLLSNIPQFDPSNLQSGIAGLTDRLDNLNIPEYKAPDLSGFARKEDLPSIDTSQFLTKNDMPRFDPRDYRDDFLSIAREGIQMPEFKAPDLSGFARKEDIPSFDREAFRREILNELPTAPVFDREALIRDVRGGIDIPQAPVLIGKN